MEFQPSYTLKGGVAVCVPIVLFLHRCITRRLLYNFSTIVGGLCFDGDVTAITDKGISSFTASNNARPTHEVPTRRYLYRLVWNAVT